VLLAFFNILNYITFIKKLNIFLNKLFFPFIKSDKNIFIEKYLP